MKNKRKVYISLPMAGYEDTIWSRYESAVAYIKQKKGYESCEIIPPVDISDYNPNIKKHHKSGKHTYGYYLGKDREVLCECTDILLYGNWQNSKGCKIEKYTAETLGINVLYSE